MIGFISLLAPQSANKNEIQEITRKSTPKTEIFEEEGTSAPPRIEVFQCNLQNALEEVTSIIGSNGKASSISSEVEYASSDDYSDIETDTVASAQDDIHSTISRLSQNPNLMTPVAVPDSEIQEAIRRANVNFGESTKDSNAIVTSNEQIAATLGNIKASPTEQISSKISQNLNNDTFTTPQHPNTRRPFSGNRPSLSSISNQSNKSNPITRSVSSNASNSSVGIDKKIVQSDSNTTPSITISTNNSKNSDRDKNKTTTFNDNSAREHEMEATIHRLEMENAYLKDELHQTKANLKASKTNLHQATAMLHRELKELQGELESKTQRIGELENVLRDHITQLKNKIESEIQRYQEEKNVVTSTMRNKPNFLSKLNANPNANRRAHIPGPLSMIAEVKTPANAKSRGSKLANIVPTEDLDITYGATHNMSTFELYSSNSECSEDDPDGFGSDVESESLSKSLGEDMIRHETERLNELIHTNVEKLSLLEAENLSFMSHISGSMDRRTSFAILDNCSEIETEQCADEVSEVDIKSPRQQPWKAQLNLEDIQCAAHLNRILFERNSTDRRTRPYEDGNESICDALILDSPKRFPAKHEPRDVDDSNLNMYDMNAFDYPPDSNVNNVISNKNLNTSTDSSNHIDITAPSSPAKDDGALFSLVSDINQEKARDRELIQRSSENRKSNMPKWSIIENHFDSKLNNENNEDNENANDIENNITMDILGDTSESGESLLTRDSDTKVFDESTLDIAIGETLNDHDNISNVNNVNEKEVSGTKKQQGFLSNILDKLRDSFVASPKRTPNNVANQSSQFTDTNIATSDALSGKETTLLHAKAGSLNAINFDELEYKNRIKHLTPDQLQELLVIMEKRTLQLQLNLDLLKVETNFNMRIVSSSVGGLVQSIEDTDQNLRKKLYDIESSVLLDQDI